MDKSISSGQIRAINVTLGVRGLADDKETIVSAYTNGRTDDVTQMYMNEARELLMAYNQDRNDKNNLMMRKMFAQAHEMGWITEEAVVGKNGYEAKKNYQALYNWIDKYGYLKKGLRKYTYAELPKLVSQLEFGPYAEFLKKRENDRSQ